MTTHPQVELLYFEGCPNWQDTQQLVKRVAADLRLDVDVRLVRIANLNEAIEHRFLGSPTVRVDGLDVEPGAAERTEYVYACRVYRTDQGFRGAPDEAWVRSALDGFA